MKLGRLQECGRRIINSRKRSHHVKVRNSNFIRRESLTSSKANPEDKYVDQANWH